MKKIFSLILSAAMISTVAAPAMATSWTPSDIKDPKCIDISKLGDKNPIISLPNDASSANKNDRNVCGCDTCRVDAVTYSQLGPYIDELVKRYSSNKTIPYTKKSASCTNLNYLDSSCQSREYRTRKLEKENEIENIKGVLKSLQRGIKDQNYKGNNYYFSSMNNNYLGTTSLKDFWSKDDIKDDPKFDDTFFEKLGNSVNETLVKIENGEIKPGVLELIKSAPISKWISIGVPAILVGLAAGGVLVWKYNKNIRNYVKNKLNKGSKNPKNVVKNLSELTDELTDELSVAETKK